MIGCSHSTRNSGASTSTSTSTSTSASATATATATATASYTTTTYRVNNKFLALIGSALSCLSRI